VKRGRAKADGGSQRMSKAIYRASCFLPFWARITFIITIENVGRETMVVIPNLSGDACNS
jgi:hypothetical protein